MVDVINQFANIKRLREVTTNQHLLVTIKIDFKAVFAHFVGAKWLQLQLFHIFCRLRGFTKPGE